MIAKQLKRTQRAILQSHNQNQTPHPHHTMGTTTNSELTTAELTHIMDQNYNAFLTHLCRM